MFCRLRLPTLLVALLLGCSHGFTQDQRENSLVRAERVTATRVSTRASVADGIYFIRSTDNGKYLAVSGNDTQNGALLIQWDFANQGNHQFELKNLGNGVFTLRAQHSGRYLNVAGQSLDDNAPIMQWDYADQANLRFSLSGSGPGFMVRGEQSGRFWSVQGGAQNADNGAQIVQTEQFGSHFAFEPAVRTRILPQQSRSSDLVQTGVIEKTRRTADGQALTSRYRIAPSLAQPASNARMGRAKYMSSKPAPSEEVDCKSTIVRISLDDDSFMTADIAAQINEVVPGSVFNILDYLNGSWKREQNALRPIELSSDVKNVIQGGVISQRVDNPTKGNLQQAVANLYGQFSSDPNKQASLSYSATIKEVHNQADFQLQIGAGAHYLTYSVDNLFDFQRGSKRSYLLLDITKIMFTIEASAPQGGFFSNDAMNQDANLVYLKKADYGMRVLASVETNESSESIANKLNLRAEALVAGGNVSLDVLSREMNQSLNIKMFVVGGQSRDIVPAYSMADLKAKVEAMARSLTYHTSQPIRYTVATTRDNFVVSYNTATDEFIKQTCTPPAARSAGANVELSGLLLKGLPEGGDLEMYGKVWVMAYRADGTEVPAERGQNMLLELPGEQSVDLDESANSIAPDSRVRFSFAAGTAEGSYIDVYFSLIERDANPDYAYGDGDDDHFTFRYLDSTKYCDVGKQSTRTCRKRIFLDELPKFDYREIFSEGSDGIELTRLSISKTPLQ